MYVYMYVCMYTSLLSWCFLRISHPNSFLLSPFLVLLAACLQTKGGGGREGGRGGREGGREGGEGGREGGGREGGEPCYVQSHVNPLPVNQ